MVLEDNTIFEAISVATFAAFGWLLQRLWASKPSYRELDLALQKAMNDFRISDMEADILRIKPLELAIEQLKATQILMHVENKQDMQELTKDIKRLIALVGSKFADDIKSL